VYIRALHWSLSWARSIKSIPFHPISLRSILILKNAVFWGVAPCRCSGLNRRFGGLYRLHLQGRKIR
jgi:hypothetical protein